MQQETTVKIIPLPDDANLLMSAGGRPFLMKLPVAVFVISGPSFSIELANERAQSLLGKHARELVNKSFRDLLPTEEQQSIGDILLYVFASGREAACNDVPVYVSKEIRYFHLNFQPVKNDKDLVESVMIVAVDVTANKREKEELARHAQRYRSLIEAGKSVIWVTDAMGAYITPQHSWEAYTGQPFEQHKGFGWIEMIHPDDRERIGRQWQVSLEHKSVHNCWGQMWSKAHNGYRHFTARAVPILDEEGNVKEWIGMDIDIHDQKMAEMALVKSEQTFRELADAIPQMIWTITPGGIISYGNKKWTEYQGPDTINTPLVWEDILYAGDAVKVKELWDTMIPAGQGFTAECRFLHPGGEACWHLLRIAPVKSPSGDITAWLGAATDIHRQKTFAEELERKVQDRTRSLQEVNRKLEDSNHELEQFAYIASHDLQEPLRKIKAFGDILKGRYHDLLGDNGADMIDRMQSASYRMKVFIDNLLTYSRVSANAKPHEPVNLNELLREVTFDLETLITEKKGRVEVSELPVVTGDRLQLGQLFQNLLSNAIKFNKPGEPPRVVITGKVVRGNECAVIFPPQDASKQFLYIEVQDNGIGFEPEYAEKIFQIFQRLHSRSEYEGTGIGLSIVKKVIENHKGYITAESVYGQGALFRILLPL